LIDERLLGESEANTLVAPVEDRVVLTHEDITEDPEWAVRGWDVDAHHGEDALLARLESVLGELEGVWVTSDLEGDVRSDLRAVNRPLFAHDGSSTEKVSDLGDLGGWTSEEGGARVDDGGLGGGERLAVDLDIIEGDAPVVLGLEWDVGEVTSVVGLVNATDHEGARGVVTEVEGEHVVGKLAGLDEVAHWGLDAVDGDAVEAEAEDTVELTNAVGKAEALGVLNLSEVLLLDNLASDGDGILGPDAGDWTGTVLDLELGTVLGVGGGLGRVVLVLEETNEADLGVRNPKVGGASVEDHVESLGWGTDGSLAVVLGVLEVVDLNITGGGEETVPLGVGSSGETALDDLLVGALEHWDAVDGTFLLVDGGGDDWIGWLLEEATLAGGATTAASEELAGGGVGLEGGAGLDDTDVTLVTPGWAPRVLDLPVVLARVGTVTDHEDTVVEVRATGTREDTILVELESRLVSLDGDGDRSLGDSSLHLWNGVRGDVMEGSHPAGGESRAGGLGGRASRTGLAGVTIL